MKVVHIATLHKRHDSRILIKECASLYKAGFDVTLIVGDGAGDENFDGVTIIDVGRPEGRFAGRLVPMWHAMRKVRQMSPDVIHFHDPMFLPLAIMLALSRWRVIYDVHEDYPRQVSNLRFALPIRFTASIAYTVLEWIGSFPFTRIIAATPHIANRFPTGKTVLVQNFPLLDELNIPDPTPMNERPLEFTYIGGITEVRNIYRMIEAVSRVAGGQARLRLAGQFFMRETQRNAEQMPGWSSVKFEGWVSREGVAKLLADGRAGLVVLKPVPHEMVSLPIKLFEYMAAGLPVISSDFPVWREIVEGAQCGLLVDPTSTDELVRAMQWILDNPEESQAMGQRGRIAVTETYNWDREAEALIACYRSLFGETSLKSGTNGGR